MSETFHRLLRARQRTLTAELEAGRDAHRHPVPKGDASELNWVGAIQKFLPRRYCVSKAFVIDSKDGESEQLDVVIYDQQYSPLVFEDKGGLYIPAESVYAVFESKQELNAKHIKYAGEKVASVRRLHRTSAEICWAGGMLPAATPAPILGGIVTTTSKWSPPLGKPFKKAIAGRAGDERLDLGCVATVGAFDIEYRVERPTIHRNQDDDMTLAFFLMRLFVRLQPLATARAIDMAKYVGDLKGWPED